MARQCERCRCDISVKHLLSSEDYEKILCPNCGRELYATKLSKILYLIVSVMIFAMFMLMPINNIILILLEGAWLLFSKFYLPAFLYLYEEKKEEEDY